MKTYTPFLEQVRLKGHLLDASKAKQVTEVVFRTMRDLITAEAIKRVEKELNENAAPAHEQPVNREIAELWKDTDPVVSQLSQIRPPEKMSSEAFLYRVAQEAALTEGIKVETAVEAVFSATKKNLSSKRIEEIAEALPDRIEQIWQRS